MTGDAVHHRREVERRRDIASDFGKRRGLARPALRLVEEAGVLERDTHSGGQRGQQAHVRIGKRILFPGIQRDDAARFVADQDGHSDIALADIRRVRVADQPGAELDSSFHYVAADHQRLPVPDHVRSESSRHLPGLDGKALAVLQVIRRRDHVVSAVIQRDRHILGVEDLRDLVADEVDDRLEVELRGQALLDAVDDRKLRGTLLTLLEKPLRLVEEASVLEGHAHRVGQRLEQAHIGIAERVLALDIGQTDNSAGLFACDHRHKDRRSDQLRPGQRVRTILGHRLRHVFVDDERLARAQDVRGKTRVP